jgi:hypothetical protein
VSDIKYWKKGTKLIEACLAKSVAADPLDVPFPLVDNDAKIWHMAQRAAYQHALEMMGYPAECFIRLPALKADGSTVYVDYPISVDRSPHLSITLHSKPDGSLPSLAELGSQAPPVPVPSKCDCDLRNRQWNGYGKCLFCGGRYTV